MATNVYLTKRAADGGDEDSERNSLQAELESTHRRMPGLAMLLLSTADGRVVAHCSKSQGDARRIAAMANSFLTLGETLAREAGKSAADYATVSTGKGCLVLVRITSNKPYTLSALGTSDASLAVVLYTARECAARLRTALHNVP